VTALDPAAKLRNLLHAAAFCIAVALVQYGFEPERPFGPALAYSLCIGLIVWAVIDLGRHLFPCAAETGWPAPAIGLLLVVGGIVTGWVAGCAIASFLCTTWGLWDGPPPARGMADLRASVLITVVAGLAGTFYFYSLNKARYLERKMGEAQQHATEARLKLLETQLEPHMLFNTLANLRALITADPPRAQQMLDHMIAYLRATLDASRATTHSLQTEFDRLRDYLALMSVRMGPRLAFTLDLPAGLATANVPALLLQPLVENAIQHGLEPQVEGGRIDVSAHRQGTLLVLRVVDTGAGLGPAARHGAGFGLHQVRQRLAALYGDGARLDLASAGTGTQATLTFPLAT
jgi:two-component sensor histidine kinase